MIHISNKTLEDLEFPVVRQQLKEYCITALGQAKALDLHPFKRGDRTFFALQQTREYQSSAHQDQSLPSHYFEPVDKEIHLLKIENSILEAAGFQKIAALSRTANTQLSFYKKHRDLYPRLYKTTTFVEYTPVIVNHIRAIINRHGEVKSTASPLLQQLRQALQSIQHKIDSSFNTALNHYQQAGYLDEISESVYGDSRVLAVSAMYRRKVKGAILGRSKTGSIVFIQPEGSLKLSREMNNLRYDEKEEVKRILGELTENIRPYRELLMDYQDLLSTMDLIAAKVSYAQSMDGVLPKLTKTREVDLREAYHPLLYLTNKKAGKKTFPQDIKFNKTNRIIVISGPNAGGKSITLKTIGLLQVMLQSGLLIPVHPYSRMCLFKTILSDIGDHQSIENHLSTYSYRLKNMRYFLKYCDKHTLFLIDEFGTGSDPELGGALAETFLEVFHEEQAFGVITTHYANLKKMAQETQGIRNANMRFDSRSLQPEFKLRLGEAGSSFTFEVARKNGIPYRLINRSKKKVARGKIRFDKSIAKLQQERSKMAETNKKLNREKQEAAGQKKELEQKNKRIQKKLEDFQQLFDSHQHLIQLGERFEKLSRVYHRDHNKKRLTAEIFKLVAVENAKRQEKSQKQEKRQNRHREAVKQEAHQRIKPIRQKKRKQKKQEAQKARQTKKEKIASLQPKDRVRLEGSSTVGTIERIEKEKVLINYGRVTTETVIWKVELVKKAT